MSFVIHRAKKYANLTNHSDGSHVVKVENVTVESDTKFNVGYKFKDGTVLKNTYYYNPEVYGPFDALIDAALGYGADGFNLQDIVGKYAEIDILNEMNNGRIFTNIKRIKPVKDLDIEDIINDDEIEPYVEEDEEEADDDDMY
jgi:hypothetical protein